MLQYVMQSPRRYLLQKRNEDLYKIFWFSAVLTLTVTHTPSLDIVLQRIHAGAG